MSIPPTLQAAALRAARQLARPLAEAAGKAAAKFTAMRLRHRADKIRTKHNLPPKNP